MRNLKLILIYIFLKINIRLFFKITYEFTKEDIVVDIKLKDWCKNAI